MASTVARHRAGAPHPPLNAVPDPPSSPAAAAGSTSGTLSAAALARPPLSRLSGSATARQPSTTAQRWHFENGCGRCGEARLRTMCPRRSSHVGLRHRGVRGAVEKRESSFGEPLARHVSGRNGHPARRGRREKSTAADIWWRPTSARGCSVSYTHLTLPTKRIV